MTEQQCMSAVHDLKGQPLARRYRLGACLSRGEFGELYRAHDLVRDRPCSLKLVPHILHNALGPQQRLAHEVVLLSRLSHRNIIEGYELNWDEEGNLFLAMAPLDGVDLEHLLAEARMLPLTLVLEILGSVGAALQYLHDLGIVHGDIEPRSIFINHEYSHSPNEAYHAIKLLNFGMARQLAPGATSADEMDFAEDQVALAKMAYRMLTGRSLPQRSEPHCADQSAEELIAAALAQVRPALPAHVLAALKRALSADRTRHFARVQDFIHALDSELVCQRPTREIKLEELIQNLVEELDEEESAAPEMAVAPAAPCEAVPRPLETELTTRKYSMSSMPALLIEPAVRASELASMSAHPLLPAPRVATLSSVGPWLLAGAAVILVCGAVGLLLGRARTASAPAASQVPMALPQPTPPQLIIELLRQPEEPAPNPMAASVESEPGDRAGRDDKLDAAVSRRPYRPKEAERAEPAKDAPAVAAILSSAQTEYVNGDYRSAVARARLVQGQSPVQAWRIIGAAACFLKAKPLIRDAYKHLRGHDMEQRLLTYACRLNGLDPLGNPLKPAI